MSEKNTGGPAFPGKAKALIVPKELVEAASQVEVETNGMTLRDYFAAKAMQSFVRNWQEVFFDGDGEWGQKLSTRAYKLADAMLAERDK